MQSGGDTGRVPGAWSPQKTTALPTCPPLQLKLQVTGFPAGSWHGSQASRLARGLCESRCLPASEFLGPRPSPLQISVAEGPGISGALQFGNQWLSKAAASTWEPTGFKGSRIRDDSQRVFPRALPQYLLLSALGNRLEVSAADPQ